MENAALPRLGLHPDPAPMPLDDRSARRESHTRSGDLLSGMQAVEDVENPFVLGRGDPNAAVSHEDVPAAVDSLSGEVHCRRFFAAVFDRVPEQMLNELEQLRGVSR